MKSAAAGRLSRFWSEFLSCTCAEAALAWIVLALGSGFWLGRHLTVQGTATLIAFFVVPHGACRLVRRRRGPGWSGLLLQIVAGNLAAVFLYAALRALLPGVVGRGTFASFAAGFALLQLLLLGVLARTGRGDPASRGPEALRWTLLAAGVLVLHRPLLSTGGVGAGDAYWYTTMVADFVTQWRAGVFPAFVGQSEYAFNGAISPLRLAPALQHFAGLVDLATFRSLSVHGILNLTLLACYAGGVFTCYRCLRAIEPRAPGLALLLAALYGCCPGVLALAYAGDLFMSVTTLPFVPLLFYGAWRTLSDGRTESTLLMSAAAAALWYCHPPIALWGTLLAGVTQAVRLTRDFRQPRVWGQWLLGGGCFLLLALYCFVSVKSTGIPAYPVPLPVLIENLQLAFPGAWHPVSTPLTEQSDYQLGWSLWVVLFLGCAALPFARPRLPGTALLVATLVLLAFLLPVPWLLPHLWRAVPTAVSEITFVWPMQRFYVLLGALAVFLAFATLAPFSVRRRGAGALLLLVLAGGLAWSGREAGKFQRHALLSAEVPASAGRKLLPENRLLTRYSFNPFRDIPSYFSHSFIDARLANRLLDPGDRHELAANDTAVSSAGVAGPVLAQGSFALDRPDPAAPTLVLSPGFRLEPHRFYLLTFAFAHPEYVGALILRGDRFARTYWLPDSAYDAKTVSASRAFGAKPGLRHSVTLWTSGDRPEDLSLEFFFSDAGPNPPPTAFASYEFREFDPGKLPIVVETWAPYRARVNAPSAALLETPRLFTAGYRARVNGATVPVTKSPDALVMFPVPAGESSVELSYPGTPVLRLAYFASFAGWLAFAAVCLLRRRRAAGPAAAT
jgi:hypothetical protein